MRIDIAKIVMFFVALAGLATAFVLYGADVNTNADYVAGESSQVLLTAEISTIASQMLGGDAESILHAVRLQMQKYDLDMAKSEGRKAWHGKLIHEIVDTNARVKIEVYSNELNGAVWRYSMPFKKKAMVTASKMKTSYSTNGIPSRLAAARAARAAQLDGAVQTTNVIHTVNGVDTNL